MTDDEIIDELKERLPTHPDHSHRWSFRILGDVLVIKYEDEPRCLPNGEEKPDWFWCEWACIIGDKGNANSLYISANLEEFIEYIKEQAHYYHLLSM